MVFQLILLAVILFLLFYAKVQTGILIASIGVVCGSLIIAGLAGHRHKHSHGAFLSIDAYAQKSKLNTWNCGLKILLAVIGAFVCIASDSLLIPVYLLLGMTFITIALGKTPVNYYMTLMSTPVLFILLSCFAIIIEISPAPIGILSFPAGNWYLCITEQTQHLALKTMLRALGAISCLYMLSLSTPIYRIIAELRRVKIPAVIIELMYLIYRYLFILLETHQQMVYASESRLGYRNAYRTIKTMLKNTLGLMFISLRRTSDMLAAMEARCYDGEIRFIQRRYKICRIQLMTSIALMLGAIIIAGLEWRV